MSALGQRCRKKGKQGLPNGARRLAKNKGKNKSRKCAKSPLMVARTDGRMHSRLSETVDAGGVSGCFFVWLNTVQNRIRLGPCAHESDDISYTEARNGTSERIHPPPGRERGDIKFSDCVQSARQEKVVGTERLKFLRGGRRCNPQKEQFPRHSQ